ncbi:protein kinase domain-containing protein [Gloeomargarita sp.]
MVNPAPVYLHLQFNTQELWLGAMRPLALLGRNPTGDLVVDNGYTSRKHACIEYRQQQFYLRDDSLNGTFVRLGDTQQVVHIQGEELLLGEWGEISLGCHFDADPQDVIRFRRTTHLPAHLAAQAETATLPGEDTLAVVPLARRPITQIPPELQLVPVLESLVEELVLVLNPEGIICYQNPALAQVLGKPLAEVLGQDFLHFVHPEDRQQFVDSYTQALLHHPQPPLTVVGRLPGERQAWQSYRFTVRPLPPTAGMEGLLLTAAPPQAGPPSQPHLIRGRYALERILAAGSFCTTYLGRDTQRPGEPRCVIKQLQVHPHDPQVLATARRLFATEAATLERLGRHDQIPLLLAYVEENEAFYIIQDFIEGQPLSRELGPGKLWAEQDVVWLLWELLMILDFLQKHKVIHRDIKPDNIIRRTLDRKLVLIDFGSVKVLPSALSGELHRPKVTVAVGTPGYMAPEQAWGQPNLTSDLYAVGVIAVEALTGQSPQTLPKIPNTNHLDWQGQVRCGAALREVLAGLLAVDWQRRFPSARVALKKIETLFGPPPRSTDFL